MEGALCTPTEPEFRLIETFGWHPGEGFRHLKRHLARMQRSARAFDLPFAQSKANTALADPQSETPLRCRLAMDRAGNFELTTARLGPTAPLWRVAIAKTRLDEADPFLHHKTTRRALYDQTRAALPAGADEALFLNNRGEVAEGTITNIFVETQSGERLTPPLESGVLPGILRERLLETEGYAEAVLQIEDLTRARAVYMGNALRGLIPVQLQT